MNHPSTDGKIEKFFDIFEKKIRFFLSIDEFAYWYNHIRPHDAFDLSKSETPTQIFYRRMENKEALIDPLLLAGV